MTVENPYGLPAELARPVARGQLSHGCAIVALAVAAVQRERVTPYQAPDTFRGLKHLYRMHLGRELMARAIDDMRRQRDMGREARHGR